MSDVLIPEIEGLDLTAIANGSNINSLCIGGVRGSLPHMVPIQHSSDIVKGLTFFHKPVMIWEHQVPVS